MSLNTALLAAVLISAGQSEPQDNPEAVSEQPSVSLDLPLTMDDILLGEIVAQISGAEVAVRPDDVIALLKEEVDEASVDAVLSLPVDAGGYASLAALEEAGLLIVFDQGSLSLRAVVSASQRGVKNISVRGNSGLDPADSIAPADFSFGMTAIGRFARIHEQPAGGAEFEPFRAELLGFLNFGGFDGWTLAWDADIDTGRDSLLRRRNVALIRDDFESATRLTIGDLRTRPLSNFRRSVDLVGVSYRRAYEDIQPFRTLLPRGRQSFTLERRSRVVVEVDGFVAFDQQLPPGTYNLSDFPLTSGSNNATITVDDGAGPREIAFFSAFIDTDLLSEGLSRFDINLGFLSNGFSGSPRYTDEPAISASYDIGLSTDLTLGAHLEASLDLVQVSGRAAIGTPIGLFSGEVAMSQSNDGWGRSAVIQYRNRFETGQLRHNIAVQASMQNDSLRSLAGLEIMETAFDLRWLMQTPNFQVNADASYRDTGPTRFRSLGFGATWRMLGANWNVRSQVVQQTGRADDYRAVLSVSVPLARSTRGRARIGTDGDIRLEFQRFGGFSVGESQVRAQLLRDADGFYSGGAQLRYIGNRAEFEIDHQTRETREGIVSRSELVTAIGFGYADGAFQIGRPFDSGFIIVKRHESIGDKPTAIDESGLGVAARSDMFGPPLVALRAGYSAYDYAIQVDEIDAGYNLGTDRIEVMPPFRAGYRVDIGSEPLATVLMRLQLPDGEAISLATGRVVSVADGSEVGRFFTNRTGRLVIENLEPGEYLLRLDQSSTLVARITLEKGETGIVQRGAITMEPTK